MIEKWELGGVAITGLETHLNPQRRDECGENLKSCEAKSYAVRPKILPSTAEDRVRIRDIILNSGLFQASDAECVEGMFDLALAKPTPDNYRFLSAWLDGAMAGFVCFGWESLTHGTWDLFWVVTVPAA